MINSDFGNEKFVAKFDKVISISLSVDYFFVLYENIQSNKIELKTYKKESESNLLNINIPKMKAIHSGGRHTFVKFIFIFRIFIF